MSRRSGRAGQGGRVDDENRPIPGAARGRYSCQIKIIT
jgi:hypothetical protein